MLYIAIREHYMTKITLQLLMGTGPLSTLRLGYKNILSPVQGLED